ncbi:hypothetical protein DERF_003197 [Dermatophagoides farinae]|uniref:Uncharacterized protein n=1 Tax=Dermatophagoides farinae TaxID=6954 RepID=A0A922ID32_DERFA|nr:hypothetical protein HUG17_5202 [Dermatophagoides farinae]KAH9529306.1 hypothetical protein DERF_003197 [Dermatophagoides farinae]
MTMKRKFFYCLSMTCLLILNFKLLLLFEHDQIVWASPVLVNDNHNNNNNNQTIQVQLFKYNERPLGSMNDHHIGQSRSNNDEETTTILPYFFQHSSILGPSSSSLNITNNSTYYRSNSDSDDNNHPSQPRTDLYTIELTSPSVSQHHHQLQHHSRQAKLDDNIVFNYKCPKQHFIHPCDCLELDKRAEMYDDGSGDSGADDITVNGTPTFEMIEEDPIHPDLIETVVLCKNIRNAQVLTEAIRGFQGHRVNFMVLDGCKLPPFPNNLFKGIHIVWMEILNSTMQFHDNFFQNTRHCP